MMDLRSNETFLSRRSVVVATGGMVASSQTAATQAGVAMLDRGGTAADAAIAVAAALQVVQPCSTGLGGDCFCLYYEAGTRTVHAANGSGRSPRALTFELAERAGFGGRMSDFDALTVTVPGAPDAWATVHRRFGKLPMPTLLEPAIRMAADGFAVAPLTASWWEAGVAAQLAHTRYGGELTVAGRGPRPGERMRLPALAHSLEIFAEAGPDPFYRGAIAAKIVAAVREAGGVLAEEDLAAHATEWVTPISLDYRGTRVWECPPNGQGLAVLIALNVLRSLAAELPRDGSPERTHLLIESMRLGFADALRVVADPDAADIPLKRLLGDDYGRERARLLSRDRANRRLSAGAAATLRDAAARGNDTVYFCAADALGNACSFINSNFMGFGTGIVPEGCGYSLQNRGRGFVMERNHPNVVGPAKRPYHTIIPGMLTDAESGMLVGPFGVMGGMMQPQGHLQVISALLDDHVDPQSALDRARFQLHGGDPNGPVMIEDGMSPALIAALERLGHAPQTVGGSARAVFGLGQIILRDDRGVWWGGSDPRGDGCALGCVAPPSPSV